MKNKGDFYARTTGLPRSNNRQICVASASCRCVKSLVRQRLDAYATVIFSMTCQALFCLSLFAQENPPEKPTPPFLEASNAPLTITRTFEYPKATGPAPQLATGSLGRIIKTVTEIHGPVQHVLTYRSEAPNPSEFWLVDGTMIGPHPREPSETLAVGTAMDQDAGDFGQRFPDASWANGSNFVKWEMVQGEKCRVHTANVPSPASENVVNPISGQVTAWIAESSRRPVKLSATDKTILFTYTAGPASPIVLPEKYAAFFKMLKLGATGRAR